VTFVRRHWSAPWLRVAGHVSLFVVGGLVTVLVGRHFVSAGWPFAHADAELAVAAGAVFLAGYAVKAYGWKLLFAPGQRPAAASLAAAGGAASITGIALPGRFDDVVRIAVVRRHRGCPAGVKALMLSLVTLGLVDTVALTPLASSAAVAGSGPTVLRIGFGVVAAAGVAAGAAVLMLPRLGVRFRRFRIARWLADEAPTPGAAAGAFGFVLASWVLRWIGTFLLLGALGLGISVMLAMVFICAGAASTALPIAPGGGATHAAAGAGALVATGVATHEALTFALAEQILVIVAGAAVLLACTALHALQRRRAHA